ncbi:MAG: triose-phosphate isomerase [Marinosulfonomonas sp.]|nr:triose-phosphate isomerase [Marinosulfonomonas sp.]
MDFRKKLIAGNWKMNGTGEMLDEVRELLDAHPKPKYDILICPPATLLAAMSSLTAERSILTGGQDCHHEQAGAHTGDISGQMLADAGASFVILGHSERRADHGETDDNVNVKARAAIAAGLKVVICVGETLAEREAANTLEIIAGQLAGSVPDLATGANLVVAYEPVWAIGTGKVATLEQIGEVHDFIRMQLEKRLGAGVGRSTRLLYGGSVKAGNAAEIFGVSNVDGALVGGASLKAADFSPIINALDAAS